MRLIATSDTHKEVREGTIPDGDVFIHAGDFQTTGYVEEFHEMLYWMHRLPHKEKILVPGNHDFHLINYPGPALQQLRAAGFTVLGFPGNAHFYTKTLPNGMIVGGFPLVNGLQERWAFGLKHFEFFGINDPYRDMLYSLIRGCDILVTHAPVYGFLDQSKRDGDPVSVGDKQIRHCIEMCPPDQFRVKHIIHGHIHEARGTIEKAVIGSNTVSIHNVAMCDRAHRHTGKPLILDL